MVKEKEMAEKVVLEELEKVAELERLFLEMKAVNQGQSMSRISSYEQLTNYQRK